MVAVKENRVYHIDETAKESYRKDGYDIYDEDGNIIEYSLTKTVPYEKYAAVVAELEALKAQLPSAEEEKAEEAAETKTAETKKGRK